MATVRDVLRTKGSQVYTIDRQQTVFAAIQEMTRCNAGALVVTEGDQVVGVVTERDYLRKVALEGRSSRTTPVHAIASAPVMVADLSDPVEHCLGIMTRQRCRHLPIRGEGPYQLAGIVSIGDCVKQLVREQKAEIADLQDYIQGRYG